MRAIFKPKYLPWAVLGAGLLGLLLRLGLYALGVDDKGLMDPNHPLHVACLLLAVATGICTGVTVWRHSIPARKAPLAGNHILVPVLLTTFWFLLHAFSAWEEGLDGLGLARVVLSFCAIPCIGYTGYATLKKRRVPFWVYGLLCGFYALELLCRYQKWSGNPQLIHYMFHIFACAFLTLTGYYRTARAAGMKSPRMQLFCSLMAVFFCLLALVGEDGAAFYLGSAMWVLLSLERLLQLPQSPKGQ